MSIFSNYLKSIMINMIPKEEIQHDKDRRKI